MKSETLVKTLAAAAVCVCTAIGGAFVATGAPAGGTHLTVTIAGAERPQVGVPLVAKADAGGCAFAWRRGTTDASGGTVLEPAAVSKSATYVPTAADYEHWLQVTATKGGETVSEKIWFSRLPVLYVDLEGGAQEVDALNKEHLAHKYRRAGFRLQGNAEFDEQYRGDGKIKGRGNTSWLFYPQKPYKLKLGEKADLFGFGKNKHWVLISNFGDNAMVRNRLASDLAKELGVYGMDMTWVPLVLNGRYHGVYTLCEHIRVGRRRINVFDWEKCAEKLAKQLYARVSRADGLSKDDADALETQMTEDLSWITTGKVAYKGRTYDLRAQGLMKGELDTSGGFLFEFDRRDDAKTSGEPMFATAKGSMLYHYGSPKFGYTDATLSNSVVRLLQDFEDAMMSVDGYTKGAAPRHFSEIASLDSMAAFWLVNETLGNIDSANFSRYAYKDCGEKLTFGPVWDFDLGSHSPFRGGKMTSVLCGGKRAQPDAWAFSAFYTSYDNFMLDWLNDPIFCLRVVQLYRAGVRPWLDRLLARNGTLDQYHGYIGEAGLSHDVLFGQGATVMPETETGRGGFENDTRNFRAYMTRRRAWLDQQFGYGQTLAAGVEAFMRSTRNWHKHDARSCRAQFHDKDDGSRLALDVAADGKSVRVTVKARNVRKARCYVNGLFRQDVTKEATLDISKDKGENAVDGAVLVVVDGYSSDAKTDASTFIVRNYAVIEAPDAKR